MNDSTFNRLFIIMCLAMTILTILLIVLASLVSSDVNAELDAQSELENSKPIVERLKPVGHFAAQSALTVVAESVVLSGEQAYASCAACHSAGIAGAPAYGDASAWSARIAKGAEALYANAINGYQGEAGFMPAKGGNTALSDESVKAAVDYMIAGSQ